MAQAIVTELKQKADAVWANLKRQLEGLEPYLDRAPAPGEWTAREVLAHLLSEPGWEPVAFLRRFAEQDLPQREVTPGQVQLTAERRAMMLQEFLGALDAQRRDVFAYLESLSEDDLSRRKARIPLYKRFLGTDEVPLRVYVGAMFDLHWNDHAGQLAKIRKAVGLPNASPGG